MNDAACEIKSQAVLEEFAQMLMFMQTAYQEGRTAHEVESGLWRRMLKLAQSVFRA